MGSETPFQVVGTPLFGENDADVWKKFRKKSEKTDVLRPPIRAQEGGRFFFRLI